MHPTSKFKLEAFLNIYASGSKGKTVLDVGSRAVREGGYTYRAATDQTGLVYTGLDMEMGHNVDIVPANPYIWDEIVNEQFDFVISGQAFEHNPFMWITFCEIARVLKQGGRACIIAPSAGSVHRFPFDCWRYYPDSWAALCALTGLELTESIREPRLPGQIRGSQWVDSVVVATKPIFSSAAAKDDFYRNLAENIAPFKTRRYDVRPAVVNEGPAYREYLTNVKKHLRQPDPAEQKLLARRKQIAQRKRQGAALRPGVGLRLVALLSGRQDTPAARGRARRAARLARRGINKVLPPTHSSRRVHQIAQATGAQSYLEIGVSLGRTFNSTNLPRKVAVDPQFKFDPAEFRRAGVDFFEIPSDTYFEKFAGSTKFDVIFIDGLHVFDQAYRDFCNSLKHAHERTIWLIDDVVPDDEYSALPDRRETQRRRREAGIVSPTWHGDVYKVIFAIHDLHPDYSFVTVNTGGNPQTLVWKAPRANVTPAFGGVEAIAHLTYADFLKRQDIMNLRPEEEAFRIMTASVGRGGRAA